MNRRFIYGTAWKKDETASCVLKAIHSGFTAFDTACQPKHYREDLVGEAIRRAFADGTIKDRSQIWIQTKFTRPSAHDPENCPYDLSAPIEEQVHKSIQMSLHNLRHSEELDGTNDGSVYLDSLILHSPSPDLEDTLAAWRVMSSYVPHRIRALGVANLSCEHLMRLYEAVEVKPSFVQNRLHPETDWEIEQRRFCVDKGILFQAHKVLKRKEFILDSELLREVASAVGVNRQVAMYLLVRGLGDYMTVVNGTKSEEHMKEDLEGIVKFNSWWADEGEKGKNQTNWTGYMACFTEMIGQSSRNSGPAGSPA
ncbi:Aldo/keto reductase [Cryphonectria parasitica EP155]|uniref:Aldo/keto reductase n=1 Tax=Cryphonectria parasitica (strain ATCC 38755 / EP155) TaxID=660469 RepID=A0A9P5CSI1_CRYP1|nr:Aldo/keto reductase [Cryphonectria parasitica EP155]KAF3769323.1 Aldo/keto reductase [Cryphonectria parasitica EP155]